MAYNTNYSNPASAAPATTYLPRGGTRQAPINFNTANMTQPGQPAAGGGTWQQAPSANMTQTPSANNGGWQQGPALGMPQGNTPAAGPNIGGGGGAPANNQWSPAADYQNADGTWHQNAQYGQQGSNIGQNPPRQGQNSGESGPWAGAPGSAIGGWAPNSGPNIAAYAPSTDINKYSNEDWRVQQAAMQNANMPFLQLAQNQYQYSNDADEAKRRFDLQFGQTGQQNQWQQGFSDRQQTQAEYQAQIAQQQWSQQFGQQTINDDRNYGLNQQQMMNQNNQFNSQLANQSNQFQQTYGLQAQNQDQQYGLQQQQMALSQVQNSQQYGLAQSQLNNTKLNDSRNYGLNVRGADLAELQNSQQYGLQQGALDLSKLTQEQNNALQTGQLSLAQLAQQQQAAYQQGQLGQGTRSLDLQQWQQEQGMQLSRDQMAQQAQQQAAQLAQQKEAAYLQATGRNQAPNARWMRAT